MKKTLIFVFSLLLNNFYAQEQPHWEDVGIKKTTPTALRSPNIGRIVDIEFHSTNPNIMYAASPWGGVFKTTDGAESWTPTITDYIPSNPYINNGYNKPSGAAVICFDQTTENLWYFGSGNSELRSGYYTKSIIEYTDPGPDGKKLRINDIDLVNESHGIYRVIENNDNSSTIEQIGFRLDTFENDSNAQSTIFFSRPDTEIPEGFYKQLNINKIIQLKNPDNSFKRGHLVASTSYGLYFTENADAQNANDVRWRRLTSQNVFAVIQDSENPSILYYTLQGFNIYNNECLFKYNLDTHQSSVVQLPEFKTIGSTSGVEQVFNIDPNLPFTRVTLRSVPQDINQNSLEDIYVYINNHYNIRSSESRRTNFDFDIFFKLNKSTPELSNELQINSSLLKIMNYRMTDVFSLHKNTSNQLCLTGPYYARPFYNFTQNPLDSQALDFTNEVQTNEKAIHDDLRQIVHSPHDNSMWFATDGGVSKIVNNVAFDKSDGLGVSYLMTLDTKDNNYAFGAWDTSTSLGENQNNDWNFYDIAFGDGLNISLSPRKEDLITILSMTNNNIRIKDGKKINYFREILFDTNNKTIVKKTNFSNEDNYYTHLIYENDNMYAFNTRNNTFEYTIQKHSLSNSEYTLDTNWSISKDRFIGKTWSQSDFIKIKNGAISANGEYFYIIASISSNSPTGDIFLSQDAQNNEIVFNQLSPIYNGKIIRPNLVQDKYCIVLNSHNPNTYWFIGYEEGTANITDSITGKSVRDLRVYKGFKENGEDKAVPISGSLHGEFKALLHDNSSIGGLYFVNELGVKYYDETINQWIQIDGNLTNSAISDAKFNNDTQHIYVATKGRGAWRASSYCSALEGSYLINQSADDLKKHVKGTISTTSNQPIILGGFSHLKANTIELNPGFEFDSRIDNDLLVIDAVTPCSNSGTTNFLRNAAEGEILSNEVYTNEPVLAKEIVMYPNPTYGKLNCRIEDQVTNGVVTISNASGVVLRTMNISTNVFSTDLSDFPKGLYLLNINYNNKTISKKIILK